ncbi:MFS transporter [Spongiactinospora sp. TRM90649]|uniref:MFS transporter n=1 Tax=Spongiactinospora sp. TRM90649 TaxID=3031114 RepID=UPI0023F76DFE|nr:MFS transporter [Spongiactinospora sp. TRM90649]MDF5755313.1 MFS transporter [Spongiactinospora sp. TRM90649]
MNTYREVFAIGEFRALFGGQTASIAGKTTQMLALSTLVYASTGSPLLAALAYFAGFLPQAIGALTLLSLADRIPPRRLLVTWDLIMTGVVALLALGVLPVWAMIALVMACGVFDAVAGAGRVALLADLLPGNGYVLGRSIFNIASGGMQIAGFAGGGLLLGTIGPHGALWVTAGLYAVTALINRLGLTAREPRSSERATPGATWRANRVLFGDRAIRGLLFVQWLPNGLIVGAEALFVPYAPHAAGLLFGSAAAGMLLGDVIIGRWTTPRQRLRLAVPLYVLLAVPYLAFVATPPVPVAAALIFVASFGYAGHLSTQERYLMVVPERTRGQALGLAGTGMLTMQAVGASTAGSVAEFTATPVAMAIMAGASLVVTVCLLPSVRYWPPTAADSESETDAPSGTAPTDARKV